MSDPIQDYIRTYQEAFEKKVKRRSQELELAEEAANLGTGVVAKGIKKLVKKAGLDFEELEESNKQLSKRVQERARKIDKKLSHIPDEVPRNRKSRLLMMQELACIKETEDPCLWRPAAIFVAPIRICDGCDVEITENEDLGRSYPVLFVKGSSVGSMRIAEVYCEYLWTFVPESTGPYSISANIEFSGRIVQTREYHCYADTSGSGWEYQLSMGHDQEGRPSGFSDLEGTLPRVDGAMRYDGTRTANHMAMLEGGRRVFVFLTQQFTVSARSRYATVSFNFGNPTADNYIDVPWMCWSLFS